MDLYTYFVFWRHCTHIKRKEEEREGGGGTYPNCKEALAKLSWKYIVLRKKSLVANGEIGTQKNSDLVHSTCTVCVDKKFASESTHMLSKLLFRLGMAW